MSRRTAYGLLLGILSVATALAVAWMPIGPLLSDEPLPAPPNLLIIDGIIQPGNGFLWYYLWKATIILVIVFFAALIASFFVEVGPGIRSFFAVISFAIAALHYANLLAMTNSIKIYPLFYIINININGNLINQYYLDIGQLFIIYGIYNIFRLFKE
jgi:hypothetical protein